VNRAALNRSVFGYVRERPTEMLLRQMQANRSAARYRNPEKPWIRHHAHLPRFRPYFVGEMLAMRAELRLRRANSKGVTE
jgi:hypothetical protein